MKQKLLIVFLIVANFALAQNQDIIKYSKTITAEELKEHLSVIASDEYEGRFTGEKGLEKTAEYLIKEFKGNDLTGPYKNDNSFLQQVALEKKTWIKRNITSGKNTFENNKDFIFLQNDTGKQKYEVIFAGYGIYSDKYNDYKNIEVKDKLVAFVMGEPMTKDSIYLVTGTNKPSLSIDNSDISKKFASIQGKAMASIMRGAKGLIIIESDNKEAEKTMDELTGAVGDVNMTFPGASVNPMMSLPIAYFSPEKAAELFGVKKKKFTKTIAQLVDTTKSGSGKYTAEIEIEALITKEQISSPNVLAFIEGSEKKNEVVVVCAHYDHEGVRKGKVYNGADDNGSGTVALIEVAEAFAQAKKDGNGPKRSMLFIAFTGEERGLLGSDYYARNPVFHMDSTVAALNLDMFGRYDDQHKDDINYVYLVGSDYHSSELHAISEEAAKTYTPDLKLDYAYNDKKHPEQLYYRSDQIKFGEKGVPVIFYFSGLHDDYHQPEDDVEKIEFEVLEKRVRLVFATAWKLANREERIIEDK